MSESQPPVPGPLLVRLQVQPGAGLALVGPGWAALAGMLASGRLTADGPALLAAVLAVILADPMLGGLWATIVGTGWWSPAEGVAEPTLPPPALPHAAEGSPAHRLTTWLGLFWGPRGERRQSVAQAGFLATAGMAIAAVLGVGPVFLTVGGVALCILGKAATRYGQGGRWLEAAHHFALAWLVGYTALGVPEDWRHGGVPLAFVLAGLYTWAYFGYRSLATRRSVSWALWALDGGQVLAALVLVMANRPWQAGLVGLLLAAQGLWQPRLCRDGDGMAYLRSTYPFLLASVLAAFV